MSLNDLFESVRKALMAQKGMSIMVGLALVVLAVVVLNGRSPRQAPPSLPGPVIESKETGESAKPERPPRQEKSMPQEIQALLGSVGRTDPFSLPKRGVVRKVRRQSEFSLEGIIWDRQKPLAIINDQIVSEGEVLEGRVIERIEKNRVILKGEGRSEIMTLADDLEEEEIK